MLKTEIIDHHCLWRKITQFINIAQIRAIALPPNAIAVSRVRCFVLPASRAEFRFRSWPFLSTKIIIAFDGQYNDIATHAEQVRRLRADAVIILVK